MSQSNFALRGLTVALISLGLGACSLNGSDSLGAAGNSVNDPSNPSNPNNGGGGTDGGGTATSPLAPVTGALTMIPVVGAPLAGVVDMVTSALPIPSTGGDAGGGSGGTSPLAPVTGAVTMIPVIGTPLAGVVDTITGSLPLDAIPTGGLPVPGAGGDTGGGNAVVDALMPVTSAVDQLTTTVGALPGVGAPLAMALNPVTDGLATVVSTVGEALGSGLGAVPLPLP